MTDVIRRWGLRSG